MAITHSSHMIPSEAVMVRHPPPPVHASATLGEQPTRKPTITKVLETRFTRKDLQCCSDKHH
eukprot:m.207976 g.207976  ORF g.207976 m.207976 type:complete len:62 (+) comp15544_c0_seq3:365-550(+)